MKRNTFQTSVITQHRLEHSYDFD